MRREPTDAERKLWFLLRDRRFGFAKFRRQVLIGRYVVDFVCLRLKLLWRRMAASTPKTRRMQFATNGWRARDTKSFVTAN